MCESLAAAKQKLRQHMLLKLRTLTNEEKLKASKKMYDCLSEHAAFKQARTVMMYTALSGEISLDLCFPMAWAAGKTVALPRVEGNNLKPCRVLNLEKDLTAGAYNVLEPERGLVTRVQRAYHRADELQVLWIIQGHPIMRAA
jgi:5-formyltetrahydrofolate cyclo-ligase